MSRDHSRNYENSGLCRFDVRQAPYGGYHTRIAYGSADASLVDGIAYRWSYGEPAEALRDDCSIYLRSVRAEPEGHTSCISCISRDPEQPLPAVWATHVLTAVDGRSVLRRCDLPAELLASRGVVLRARGLNPRVVERFVRLLGIEAAVALVGALHQGYRSQLGLIGPIRRGTRLGCEERLWALRVALWLVNMKNWPSSWAVLGSTSNSFKHDRPQLVWYPEQPASRGRSCVIELDHRDTRQMRPGVPWIEMLEKWFRSGDFMRVARAARRLNRWDADPSDDDTATALAQCNRGQDQTPSALLKMADVVGRLGHRPGCSARLKVRAARLALSGSPPDADSCRIIDGLRQDPAIWTDPALVTGVPVAELLDAAFESGGQQPERVLLLLTTLPGQQAALRGYLRKHPNLLTDWLSSSADGLGSRAIRRLGHRLFAYAGICPSPVFQRLIQRQSGTDKPCSTADLVLEFWDYPVCRRIAVEQNVCRALLGTEELPAEAWISLSAHYLVELASAGSFVEFENQAEKSVARVAEWPRLFEQWVGKLITQARMSGVAVSLMQAVRQTQLELSVKDRLSGPLWAAASLHPAEAAAWAEGFLMDDAARNDRGSSRALWLEKAIHCHLQSGDAGALNQLLSRCELVIDEELNGVVHALLDQLEDLERAMLWEALSEARSFRCNVTSLRQWAQRCQPEQRRGLLSLVGRVLAIPQAKPSVDDLATYHQLEQLVTNHPNPAQGRRELALAFAQAATRLLECFAPDDQQRSLVRSRARWLRLSKPGSCRRACGFVADFFSDTLAGLPRRLRTLKPAAAFSEQEMRDASRTDAPPSPNSCEDAVDRV